MPCHLCGDCCRTIPVEVPEPDFKLLDYFAVRGIRMIGSTALIPSICPHLKRDIEPTTRRPGKSFFCDIYLNRPELCRVRGHDSKHYIPEGCTNDKI